MPSPSHSATARSSLVGLGALILLLLFAPSRSGAQSAQRVVPDMPSARRETRVQHDSLAVHFLRTPKGKPAARSAAGASKAESAKFGGRAAPAAVAPPVTTPLPQRTARRKS